MQIHVSKYICLCIKINFIYRVLNPEDEGHITSTEFHSTAYGAHGRNRQQIQQQETVEEEIAATHQQHQAHGDILRQHLMQQQQQQPQQEQRGAMDAVIPQQQSITAMQQGVSNVGMAPQPIIAHQQPMQVSGLPVSSQIQQRLIALELEKYEQQLLEAAMKIRAAQDMQKALAMQHSQMVDINQYNSQCASLGRDDLKSVVIGVPELSLNLDHLLGKPGVVGRILEILNSPDFSRAVPTNVQGALGSVATIDSALGSSGSTVKQSMASLPTSMSLQSVTDSSKSLTDSQKNVYEVESNVHWPIDSKTSLESTR